MNLQGPLTVLCADDNEQVGEALRQWLARQESFRWVGHLPTADRLPDEVSRLDPDIVVLDIDMPGRNPFEACAEVARRAPRSRVVVFSGHVRLDLIERAIESGAWAYVSKNDGESHLSAAMSTAAEGELYLSPEARGVFAGAGALDGAR